jgi:hypothetical protein
MTMKLEANIGKSECLVDLMRNILYDLRLPVTKKA